MSTPIMSQQKSLNFFLNTPPSPFLYSIEPGVIVSLNDEHADPSDQNLFTPSIFDDHHHDRLEPPAWEPPEADEVE